MNCEVCNDTEPCREHYLTFGAYDGCFSSNIATRIALTNVFKFQQPVIQTGEVELGKIGGMHIMYQPNSRHLNSCG